MPNLKKFVAFECHYGVSFNDVVSLYDYLASMIGELLSTEFW